MPSVSSGPDPYAFNEYGASVGFSNSRGRTPVSSALVASTVSVIVDGQSEHANSNGTAAYTASNANSHHINIYDGEIYPGLDPILGASPYNAPTSPGPSCQVMMIADRIFVNRPSTPRVVMAPIALGGTPWAMYDPAVAGSLFTRFSAAYRRLAKVGLTPNAIIAARGATDNNLGTSAASVKASIWAWADGVRALGCVAPIYVGKFTMLAGAVSSAVQTGIDNSIDVGRDIRAGYDGDANLTVAGGFRLVDQTHLSATGLTKSGNGWADLIFP